MPDALPIVPPDAIDAPWLTAALRASGHDVEVRGVTTEQIGTGQIGDTFRLTLDYAGGPPAGAPRSVIGKFPSANAESRQAARLFRIYQAEALFYRELAATAGMRVPHPYLALFDEETHDFVLLLEDLGHLRGGNQMTGCTLAEARVVVREAARLHASHWEDPRLYASSWINRPETAWSFYTAEQMRGVWPGFVERHGPSLAPEVLDVARRLVEGFDRWNAPRGGPRSLAHNDLRPDNLLLGDRNGVPEVVVVDWQTMTFSYGASDLTYFLSGALPPDMRRAHEAEFIASYLEELARGGVRDYGEREFMRDYRHFSFTAAAIAIGSSMSVKRTERGDAMFMAMLEGAARHVLDLDALAVLA